MLSTQNVQGCTLAGWSSGGHSCPCTHIPLPPPRPLVACLRARLRAPGPFAEEDDDEEELNEALAQLLMVMQTLDEAISGWGRAVL